MSDIPHGKKKEKKKLLNGWSTLRTHQGMGNTKGKEGTNESGRGTGRC